MKRLISQIGCNIYKRCSHNLYLTFIKKPNQNQSRVFSSVKMYKNTDFDAIYFVYQNTRKFFHALR